MSTAVITSTHSANTTSPQLQVSPRSTVSSTSRKSTSSMQDEAANLDIYAPVSNKNLKPLHSSLGPSIRADERSHSVSDMDPDAKIFDNNFQTDSYNTSSARPSSTNTMSTNDAAIRLHDRSGVNDCTNQSNDDYILPNDIKQILTEVAQSGAFTLLPWSDTSLESNMQQTRIETFDSSLDKGNESSIIPLNKKNIDNSRILHPTAVRAGYDAHQKQLFRNGILPGNTSSTEISRKRSLEMVDGSNKRVLQCQNDYILTNTSELDEGEGKSLENAPDHADVALNPEATSEASLERQHNWSSWEKNQGVNQLNKGVSREYTQQYTENRTGGCTCLREVFRVSLAIVLDRFYEQVGYQLSPAEKWISSKNPVQHESSIDRNGDRRELNQKNSEQFYRLRRDVILSCLQSRSDSTPQSGRKIGQVSTHKLNNTLEVAPFTLQRIAEVLLSPERYYTQTHKLCNCLEKLLLVTAPSYAFGGSEGGYNTQRLRGENDLFLSSDDKGRWHSSVGQNSHLSKTVGHSPAGTVLKEKVEEQNDIAQATKSTQSSEKGFQYTKDEVLDSRTSDSGVLLREKLEAAARASLRSKFDHVTVETPPATAVGKLEGETRVRANSPPPPSLSLCGSAAGLTIPGSHGGLLRHLSPGPASPTSPDTKDKSSSVIRTLSPLLFSSPNLHGDATSPSSGTSKIASPHNSPSHHSLASGSLPPLELISVTHSGGMGKGASASTVDSETNDSFNDSASN